MQLHDFGFINYAVLFGLFGSYVTRGVYFSKRQKLRMTISWWRKGSRLAAGVSVFATTLSFNLLFNVHSG